MLFSWVAVCSLCRLPGQQKFQRVFCPPARSATRLLASDSLLNDPPCGYLKHFYRDSAPVVLRFHPIVVAALNWQAILGNPRWAGGSNVVIASAGVPKDPCSGQEKDAECCEKSYVSPPSTGGK